MNALTVVGTTMTVVAAIVFVGIVFWAYSGRRKKDFDEAAQAPFALPDDTDEIHIEKPIEQEAEQRGRQP